MMAFSIHRVLSKNPGLSPSFRFVIGLSMTLGGFSILAFFVMAVARRSFFDPQYVIPLGGMLLGNAMNSVSLGIKTFRETLVGQQARMEALACLGADSGDILQPFVIRALETAMVPTLNSMVGMGIVSLPDRADPCWGASAFGHSLPDLHHDCHCFRRYLDKFCLPLCRSTDPLR